MTPRERLAVAIAHHEQLEELQRRVADLVDESRAAVRDARDEALLADAAERVAAPTPAEVG